MPKWLIILFCICFGANPTWAQVDSASSIILTDTASHRAYNPSLSTSKIMGRSAMLPGWGQWTNRQPWKIPLIAGGLAGGIYGIVQSGKEHRRYADAVSIRLDTFSSTHDQYEGVLTLEQLLKRSGRAKTLNTTAIFFTAYTYGINVFDAYTSAKIVREDKAHPPVKAAFLSALLPGMGQVYNHKYWKVPIVWAAIGTGIGFIIYNNQLYYDFRFAYITRTDDDPNTYYETVATDFYRNSTSDLPEIADIYRRNRDLSYIVTVALYGLNIIDAIVDGHLYNFDMSDDLSRLHPRILPNWEYDWGRNVNYPGISLKLSF